MNDFTEEIAKVSKKAADTNDSASALRWSQAALNLANTANMQLVTKLNKEKN